MHSSTSIYVIWSEGERVLKNGCASHCDYDRAKVCCDVNVVLHVLLERF